VTLVGIVYTLVPAGRARSIAKWAAAATLFVFAFARLYEAVDHPTDILSGLILGVGIPVVAFRVFTPNEVFPVTYRRGRAAHLDIGGRRGEAIGTAVRDQLGLTLLEAKPVGLEGSGGSTPLRLLVAATSDESERHIFAKLYARSHVRADRWYKFGRAVLYGALEDEAPFQSVRRFVEYEDYTLLLLHHLGLPTPMPYGFVEITPEREYMIVMEFFDGAVEIGDAVVDDEVIDGGLLLVRRLWDAGLAHRDVKPANLMVRDGKLLLIDVFFVQVRPSPWRQAVDLANMMLVLALRTDAKRVYGYALKYFTEEEIAEAFAATRGVASPTQLRAALKRDHRNLLGEFRELAPARRPVAIQHWSVRRFVLGLSVLALGAFVVFLVLGNWQVVL
jgi:tRNA A-37 threonylcarbamoyl transferase component Bud32